MVFAEGGEPESTAHTGLSQYNTAPEELLYHFARLQAQQGTPEIQCPEASLKHSICSAILHIPPLLLPSHFEGFFFSYLLASSKNRSCNDLEELQIICHRGSIAQMRIHQA